jgi:hypothetical protein
MKIAIDRENDGWFQLSQQAYKELGLKWDGNMGDIYDGGFMYNWRTLTSRTDPKLIAVIEKLGKAASGVLSNIVVVEVPDDANVEITGDYNEDGSEAIVEVGEVWL